MGQQRVRIIGATPEIEEKKGKALRQSSGQGRAAVVQKEEVKRPKVKPATGPVVTAKEEKVEEIEKPKKVRPRKTQGKKYQNAKLQVEKGRVYPIEEAIGLARKTSYVKFDGSIEAHIQLIRKKRDQELARGLLDLPHGSGREHKVVVLDEAMIEKIAKSGKSPFDVAIATPALMPKLAKIARILGPRGKMPNPKAGTISNEPEKVVEQLRKGRVEYRSDDQGIIHLAIGKVSWDEKKLLENLKALLAVLSNQQIKGLVLSATMGPGIRVELPKQVSTRGGSAEGGKS